MLSKSMSFRSVSIDPVQDKAKGEEHGICKKVKIRF